MAGAQGAIGAQGAQGYGPQGITGPMGLQGATGNQGPTLILGLYDNNVFFDESLNYGNLVPIPFSPTVDGDSFPPFFCLNLPNQNVIGGWTNISAPTSGYFFSAHLSVTSPYSTNVFFNVSGASFQTNNNTFFASSGITFPVNYSNCYVAPIVAMAAGDLLSCYIGPGSPGTTRVEYFQSYVSYLWLAQ
jgi:hypothetical protein